MNAETAQKLLQAVMSFSLLGFMVYAGMLRQRVKSLGYRLRLSQLEANRLKGEHLNCKRDW